MKKLLLFSSFLFFGHFSYSQNYQGYVPFPTSNAGWVDHLLCCNKNRYFIAGDTMINSITYHKLSSYYYPYFYGAFRNDILNKRVYYISSGDTTESLLYDFDLTVGDTLIPSLKYNPNSVYRPITVLRIDTVNYGGVWRKQFTLNSCDSYDFPSDTIRWIEGIGSTQSLLDPEIDCPFETYRGSLNCMILNNITIYPDSNYSCNLITDIATNESLGLQTVLLFPSPSSGTVHIESLEEFASVKIFDMQGRLVKTVNSKINSWELPQSKGLYFIQLKSKDGRVYTRKIIHQ